LIDDEGGQQGQIKTKSGDGEKPEIVVVEKLKEDGLALPSSAPPL
jgi:hypothetical protein